MKTLKFNHDLAAMILSGEKTVTWRINDEKNLSVNDDIEIIDKVKRKDPSSWQVIGRARINQIVAKRLGDITDEDMVGHEKYASKADMVHTLQGYYGSDIDSKTTVKIVSFTFHPVKPYPLPNGAEPFDPSITVAKLFADGGSRGNPGPSASGFVLLDMHDNIIYEGGVYLGVTTNNQAEYRALKFGLEEAIKRHIKELQVFMDSMLVINQMKGTYRVKNADIKPVYQNITHLLQSFDKVTFTHVPRELNKLADSMVNEVLDTEPIDSR